MTKKTPFFVFFCKKKSDIVFFRSNHMSCDMTSPCSSCQAIFEEFSRAQRSYDRCCTHQPSRFILTSRRAVYIVIGSFQFQQEMRHDAAVRCCPTSGGCFRWTFFLGEALTGVRKSLLKCCHNYSMISYRCRLQVKAQIQYFST